MLKKVTAELNNHMVPKAERESQAADRIRVFEDIKNPQELLDFMGKNIEYGFVGKNNHQAYSWKDGDMGVDFGGEYFLQSPEELIESGLGVCFDSTELERKWFEKNGYDFKVFFIIFAKEHPNDLPTHTLLAYKEGSKWFWFEHSASDDRGIHEFNNLEDLLADAKGKHLRYALEYGGAAIDDEKDLMVFEFEKPEYGCGLQEFVNHAVGAGSEE